MSGEGEREGGLGGRMPWARRASLLKRVDQRDCFSNITKLSEASERRTRGQVKVGVIGVKDLAANNNAVHWDTHNSVSSLGLTMMTRNARVYDGNVKSSFTARSFRSVGRPSSSSVTSSLFRVTAISMPMR